MEIWKDVEGYDGLYQVSTCGRVRRDGNVLSQNRNVKNGYMSVQLCKNGKPKRLYVHRLVAEAFIENPENLSDVNHKDERKSNNCVENLEWCTRKYNNNYGANAPARARIRKVVQRTTSGEFVREWNSAMSVERALGYAHQHISHCCTGKRETANGFRWEFA